MLDSKKSQLVVAAVDDPREFGVVKEDRNGQVTHAIEKPKIPKSNKALVGIYKIQEVPHLVRALNQLISSNAMTHGEFSTDGCFAINDRRWSGI